MIDQPLCTRLQLARVGGRKLGNELRVLDAARAWWCPVRYLQRLTRRWTVVGKTGTVDGVEMSLRVGKSSIGRRQ